jgi:hypothetical protein
MENQIHNNQQKSVPACVLLRKNFWKGILAHSVTKIPLGLMNKGQTSMHHQKLEVVTVMMMLIMVFWDMTLCGFVGSYHAFLWNIGHHLQDHTVSCSRRRSQLHTRKLTDEGGSFWTTTVEAVPSKICCGVNGCTQGCLGLRNLLLPVTTVLR